MLCAQRMTLNIGARREPKRLAHRANHSRAAGSFRAAGWPSSVAAMSGGAHCAVQLTVSASRGPSRFATRGDPIASRVIIAT